MSPEIKKCGGLTMPRIELDEIEWEESGPEEDRSGRLLGSICIGGLCLHLEAYAIRETDDGVQRACVYDEDIERIYGAVGAEGGWETIEMNGREYVMIATPFCR